MQPAFTRELLSALAQRNIHTAVKTHGYIATHIFQPILPMISTLMFNLHHYDMKTHVQGTGVSNALILQNLKIALSQHSHVLVRIPVIPGFNDRLSDAEAFCQLLNALGAACVRLLPFQPADEKKYGQLGLGYAYQSVPAMSAENLKAYQRVFVRHQIECLL